MDFVTFLSQLYGKGEETANKLRSGGLTTPARFCSITSKELGSLAGISVSSAKGMIDTAKGMLQQDKKERKRQLLEIEGIGAKRAKKLRRAGLRTIKAIAGTNEEKLANLLRVPKSMANKIIRSAQKMEESIPSPGVTQEETQVLTTQILPQENSKKEEKPEVSIQLVKSFWRFG